MAPNAVKVLIVEDDEDDYLLTFEMLRSSPQAGFDVRWAQSFEEGLEQLAQGAFDVALIDYRLGPHSGVELLRQARAQGCSAPLIVLTVVEDSAIDDEARAAGAVDYLVKNELRPELLRRAIRYAIERRRGEEALRESELKFRSVTQSAHDAIIAADGAGRIISWNKGAFLIFGYTEVEVRGKPISLLFLEADRRHWLRQLEQAGEGDPAARGGSRRFECRGVSKTGVAFPAEVSFSNWRTAKGPFLGLIVRDLTDRKLAENELAEERNLLRAVVDNLPEHIYVKDLEGRYLLNNEAHARFLGVDRPEELTGHTVADFFSPEFATQFQADDNTVLRTGQPLIRAEKPIVDRTGRTLWVSTTKVPLRNHDGDIIALVCLGRDITANKLADEERDQREKELRQAHADLERSHTELKATQLALMQAEKMESLSRLSAGIGHEVKNPLGQILLGVDFLAAALPPDETWKMVLGDVKAAALRVETVINGMLDFAAPNQMRMLPQELPSILRRTLLLMKTDLLAHHIEVECKFADDLPPVRMDRNKMEQVFVNLVSNAIQAMDGGGRLTISVFATVMSAVERDEGSKLRERFREGDSAVVVEFSDTGCGIPEEKLEKIYDPFFTTKPTGQGMGLGLTVVRKIVELHGALLEIRNRPGGGVTATLTLQAEPAGTLSAI